MRRIGYAFCLVFAFALLAISAAVAQDNDYFMYVGTYTGFKYVHHSKTWGVGDSHSKGIYVSRFHAAPEKSANLNWPRKWSILHS